MTFKTLTTAAALAAAPMAATADEITIDTLVDRAEMVRIADSID